ncbi:MAG: hypothetical protein LQ350_002417 [Teloschistes chrysophthalmus]|nr:MAG: hypothetical protein LQ350_002417 [Niorma chrysophthalma]
MSTQYDSIVEPYEEFRKAAFARLENYNIRQALAPYIKGAKILDLACGTGLYSHQLIDWGASQVVGVDISAGMIATAKAKAISSDVSYQVEDCSKPKEFEGGPFDIVFGSWLLNYAPNTSVLADMFANISMNLKEGGRFVGVTVKASENPREYIEATAKMNIMFWEYARMEWRGDVDGGISTRVVADIGSGTLSFEYYHLRESAYDRAAQEGGMKGPLTWKTLTLPEDESEIFGHRLKDREGLWAEYSKLPHFSVLEIQKD